MATTQEYRLGEFTYPRGWFMRKSVALPLRKLSRRKKCIEEFSAPHPPAVFLGLAMSGQPERGSTRPRHV